MPTSRKLSVYKSRWFNQANTTQSFPSLDFWKMPFVASVIGPPRVARGIAKEPSSLHEDDSTILSMSCCITSFLAEAWSGVACTRLQERSIKSSRVQTCTRFCTDD